MGDLMRFREAMALQDEMESSTLPREGTSLRAALVIVAASLIGPAVFVLFCFAA